MIILDTSACIDYLNGDEDLKIILSDQENLVHITSITIYEVGIGLERTKRKISEDMYKELYKKWMEFISSMEIFNLGFKEAERAAKIYDVLESTGQRINDNDILIAGIIISNGIQRIIIKNIKHFEMIEGIEFIQY
ncbi:hypothetical protein LCGC14_1121760 [marine sediment metagenome]|uniref:PIN domain-containing protein n=1 Tax=marine sediment metagenome TaxID=412755 RepID=A0A0F9M3Q8_9ZZZZ|nr:type II toxin-antitoxin system VapC family toxin [archaeon]HEC41015.1 type II toxin-antitoxin system VapC family toxin [bacterium]